MSKTIVIIGVILVAAVAIGGCYVLMQGSEHSDSDITVADMLGEEVHVKKNPEHVACVSRTTYDLLVAFGLGDRIDGVYKPMLDNEWTSVLYPDSKEHFGYDYLPSHELLLQRSVDLVLSPEKYITDGLKEHGIPALNVSLYGNPDFEPYVYFLADLAKKLWPDVPGVAEKAEKWKAEFKDVLDEVSSTLESKDYPEKSVYYVRGDKNRGIEYTDTGKSFNEYIFGVLGMDFLGRSLGVAQPSTDAVLDSNPDYIVIGGIYQHTLREMLNDSIWENVEAVKTGHIYRIGIGFSPMEQMGAFTPVFLADMANKLYPEEFHYDTSSMLRDMCQRYFGIELTEQQALYMLDGLGPDGKPMA
ncbi:MAG: ABC transporter substrate-binding protein [Thermoplasmata archaeon]|jgi:iron complex transport system substrate-binding protein|nr:ABC transporter substrate-binding protein [Thermoplasmata archaeon]